MDIKTLVQALKELVGLVEKEGGNARMYADSGGEKAVWTTAYI